MVKISQNYYQYPDGYVVMAGWDKPAKSAYLILADIDDDGSDWVSSFTLDIELPFDRENNIEHVDEIVMHMKGRLEVLGRTLPQSVFNATVDDIKDNAVNIMRVHFLNKVAIITEDSPFEDGRFKQ